MPERPARYAGMSVRSWELVRSGCRVQVAQWRVARACRVSGASRVDCACDVCRLRDAILVLAQPHVVSREMRILLARCLAGCGCPRRAAAIRMNLRWPSGSCLRLGLARCSACSPLPFLRLGFSAVVFTYVKGTPMYGLKTESSFDAAHFLTDYHGKCENLHGHRWRVVAYLEQEELQTQGTHKDMVIDFADFKGALRDLTEAFDHSFVVEEGSLAPDTLACLEREGFSLSIVPFRTTAENLARYFYGKLADAGFPVSQVDVYETPNNCAIYRG